MTALLGAALIGAWVAVMARHFVPRLGIRWTLYRWRVARRYLTRCHYIGRHAPDLGRLYFPVGPSGDRWVARECRHCGRYVTEQGLLVRTDTPVPLTFARASKAPESE